MRYLFTFEKLEVWQESRRLSVDIYRLTQSFPDNEKFGLVSQLRRAAVSVASNLAEGSARLGGKEQARFSEISYASLMEVMCQLQISTDLGYITQPVLSELRIKVHGLSIRIQNLRISQLRYPTSH